jgi:hypothetical protein
MDIFEIEKRGMFSPPNGNHPQAIPDYWRENPGDEVRTDLPELTDEELNALGWKGPIQMPPFPGTSFYTHNYEWNTETREYDATELDEYEKRRRVDYIKFWDLLINGTFNEDSGTFSGGNVYQKIKSDSKTSLEINVLATEFIALITDAKQGNANVEKIQESLVELVTSISFTPEELAELQQIFMQSGMFAVYSLQ